MPTEAGRDKERIFQLSHESQSCFPSSLMDVNVCKFDVRSTTTTTRLQKVDCRVALLLLLLLPPVLRPDELLSTAGYSYLVND